MIIVYLVSSDATLDNIIYHNRYEYQQHEHMDEPIRKLVELVDAADGNIDSVGFRIRCKNENLVYCIRKEFLDATER